MLGIKRNITKLSKFQKITCLILILGFILLLSIVIPTLARFKNRSTINTVSVWDGSVASSYRNGNGSEGNPYIISNGSELAYFYTQLLTNDYDNTYFTLNSDIVFNKGIFNYDSINGIQYSIDGQTYYVDQYSNKYYDNVNMLGTEIGTVNIFNSLDGFKGSFNGGSFTIYGLYITNEFSEEVALFTNLQGSINDLYVENAMIYGGTITAGIASTTNNATLSNIVFNGNVIGKSTGVTKNINSIPTAPVINIQNTETTNYINLTNSIPFIGSEIISTSITGNYVVNGPISAVNSIKINGVTVTNGSFEIDLGSSIKSNIPVLTYTDSLEAVTLTFSNLRYNIVYNYAVTGGIIATSNNTIIKNTINKAYVYGYSTGGGLVGVTTNSLNINQSYNVGDIKSVYVSGGLVGTIEKSSNNIVVSKSYNVGDMVALNIGGLIGYINNNTGSVSISNVFNSSTTNYSIGTIANTTVSVTSAYFVNGPTAIKTGVTTGTFASATMRNLMRKTYDVNNLSFYEFIDFADLAINNQNVWVYETDRLPILFIDDITNPIADIHVSIHSWNNLSYELSTVKLNSNITFSIENADALNPPKEKYYYISNSTNPLTKTQISQITSWNLYSNVVQILEEGYYVIYVKIVANDNSVTYINTDVLILDVTVPTASLSIDDSTWSTLSSNLDSVYIDRQKYATVEASDNLSGILSIKYYITDEILSTNNLNELSDSSWNNYSDEILINEIGTHIVYIKVTDICNNITYINTDYYILDGYMEANLIVGRNSSSYMNTDAYITDKSAVTLNINYSNSSSSNLVGYTHNLMSKILLPMGTNITLIDHITDKVYEYKITTNTDIYNYNDSCDVGDLDCIKTATYPFTLFKEVGTKTVEKFFVESTYYNNGVVNEDFSIVLDLSSTNISTNYNNVVLFMELHDTSDISVRPTLYNSIKEFNIYSNVSSENTNATVYLNTDYSGNEIIFNSESLTDINISSGLNYKYVNGFKIIDTTYEDKEIGLSIRLVDSDGNIINKENFKNIIFKVGSNNYYPEEDNIVRINLVSGITDITKTLTIITNENNGNLDKGTYYFKISSYVSDDGYYYDELNNTELSIPVNVSDNNYNVVYSFDVIMPDENRIISKTDTEVNVMFNILQNGLLNNPNIRVSLYKKDQLTAYDQNYSIVDLSDYVSNDLNLYAGNVYYVSTDPIQYDEIEKLYNNFELNLVTANFENSGYKFVFELYDGTKKIGTIERYFIVKEEEV